MESFSAIHTSLARVRRRLNRQAAATAGLTVTAAACAAAVAIPALALAVSPTRAVSAAGVALGAAAIAVFAAAVHWGAELLRWRDRERLARAVGERAPELASDLLSAIQLEPQVDANAAVSGDLVEALAASTAARLGARDLDHLAPARRLKPAATAAALAAAAAAIAIAAAPDWLARGWERAVTGRADSRFDGVTRSASPVVGDIRITLDYPAYTGREPRVLPASSGDFRAMPGTTARIETTPLEPVSSARLAIGETAETELPMARDGERLVVSLEVTGATVYRFLVVPREGQPRIEETAHAIEIEPDQAPDVALYAPADELDVEGRRRVELAYTAEDDFGIETVALVWDAGEGGESGRLELPTAPDQPHTAQGKFLWDLADVALPAGARIGYHLEVADNDTVSGPNIGRSRTFYLRVFSPRERHEALLDRQRELFDDLVRVLAGRLLVEPEDLGTHRALNRLTRQLVVELGGILADLDDDKLAPPELSTTYREMKARLEQLADDESALFEAGAPPRRLAASDKRHVAQHEDDVLALADWIDRQQLENLLAITDEIAERRKRLDELFEEYARTGSQDVLAEIERELRALEQRMAELARQQGRISDDVLDQFMNTEAVQPEETASCLDEVRQLMAAGDVEAAQARMTECNELFEAEASSLEDTLAGLRGDRFGEQQRALDEVMGELADLARDEQDIAAQADELMSRYAERAAELMADQAGKARAEAGALLEQLRKRIARIPRAGLTPFSSEELPVVESRLGDVERMLEDSDLAEALAMARQAELGLETIDAELGADLDSGDPWNDRTGDAYNQVNRALPVARELVELLEQSTPAPQEIMSAEDRQRMRQLQRRQQRVRERAEKLAERARGMNEELPGNAGQAMAEGIGEALAPMERAEQRMRASDPSGARQEARDAADLLDEAQRDAKGAARQQLRSGRGMREEPVRIPGADEYRAPEAFREEILEAMKKRAPEGFAEQVKRYYEDLIR